MIASSPALLGALLLPGFRDPVITLFRDAPVLPLLRDSVITLSRGTPVSDSISRDSDISISRGALSFLGARFLPGFRDPEIP